jgi:uncharacterized membrane protein YtjA (UPF0391 family)
MNVSLENEFLKVEIIDKGAELKRVENKQTESALGIPGTSHRVSRNSVRNPCTSLAGTRPRFRDAALGETTMLYYAVIFFVIAIIAAVLGFSGIAAGAASIGKILFVIFLVLAVLSIAASLLP